MTPRARVLLVLFLLLVGFQVAKEGYAWLAHGPERARYVELRDRLVDAGVELVRTRARADTLRSRREAADRALDPDRRALDLYQARMENEVLSPAAYAAYRDRVERYNRRVELLNERTRALNDARAESQRARVRYYALADSVRAVARVLGDPYHAVPTPEEAAAERGVIQLPP